MTPDEEKKFVKGFLKPAKTPFKDFTHVSKEELNSSFFIGQMKLSRFDELVDEVLSEENPQDK